MPTGDEKDTTAYCNRRTPAQRVSNVQTKRQPYSGPTNGKFAGSPGPSGGNMGGSKAAKGSH